MAMSVQEARESLERKVAERTRALEEARDELLRKERLASLGHLASGVGHELRNPLGVMSNVVYYLEATMPDAPARVQEYLALLRKQIQLAEKIVADLLDFARVRSPERVAVSVAPFVREQLCRVDLPERIEVAEELDPGLPPVYVDPVQVGQVFFNLLTNAVQAMDGDRGRLTVRARAMNGRVRLEVEDSGPGVPPEHHDRIFEPLFTTKAAGIGLGLSVSRSLARANDGDLSVATESRCGAVFRLDLPAAAS